MDLDGLFDVIADRLVHDSTRAYTELEPRPCRRALAMLFQWVPVLFMITLLFCVMWWFLSPEIGFELLLVGNIIVAATLSLLYYVCSDMKRAYSEDRNIV
jgi:hypothetical protein